VNVGLIKKAYNYLYSNICWDFVIYSMRLKWLHWKTKRI